ncbi:AraC family transcriptional regulator [Pseudomonas abieticivorans]|uniref:AraC family transcriptional regulator n=1 Tax=Pseudomonas abieticivorans TaxID=2931382 RepID=UPI0020BEC243|nr:helix-turn-helix transcriptional regulator [Pseudomonas sp. PIA16]
MERLTTVLASADDYHHGDLIAAHCHAQTQLVYAICGVMRVQVGQGSWVVPCGHALWVPAGMEHEIRMSGAVRMRSLFIDFASETGAPGACRVIMVTPLVRELIVAATHIPADTEQCPRDLHLKALLFAELQAAHTVMGHVPMPLQPRLKALCEAFLDDPSQEASLEDWAAHMNMSSRTLARLFQRELGLSFGQWRQRTRLLLSQQRLAQGIPILEVALEHGYQSPSAFSAMFKRALGYTPSDCPQA